MKSTKRSRKIPEDQVNQPKTQVIKQKLERHLQIPCRIKINENRTTMIHLLEKTAREVKLSIHKIFIDAPEDIISAIAHYVRGTKKNKKIYNQQIRGFINANFEKLDYSHLVDENTLVSKGKVYDLQKLYVQLNREYFDSQLDLYLTWFGNAKIKSSSRVVFGQYLKTLKLIKVHRMLDTSFVPELFVSFILYHEMLHAYVPIQVDDQGRCRIHTPEFKKLEKKFAYYEEAISWEKSNRDRFFSK